MAVILCFIAYGSSFAVILSSDAYKTAKQYVLHSEEIEEKIGKPEQVNIDFYILPRGSISVAGGKGTAHYYLNVFTNGKIFQIYTELRKIENKWEVIDYQILKN